MLFRSLQTKPLRVSGTEEFKAAVAELSGMITHLIPNIPNPRWLAIRLLDGDARVEEALLNGEFAALVANQRQSDFHLSSKTALAGNQ